MTAMRKGNQRDFEYLLYRFRSSNYANDQLEMLRGMGASTDPELLTRFVWCSSQVSILILLFSRHIILSLVRLSQMWKRVATVHHVLCRLSFTTKIDFRGPQELQEILQASKIRFFGFYFFILVKYKIIQRSHSLFNFSLSTFIMC